MNQRVNLIINVILPKPNVDVHTLYIDGNMGTANNPLKTLEAEYKTDVTKIVTGIKGDVSIKSFYLLLDSSVLLLGKGFFFYLVNPVHPNHFS